MIEVRIFCDNESYFGIEIEGHANTAPKGEDLICAAVSSSVFGCINNLKNPKDFDITIEDGYTSIKRMVSPISEHDRIVLETLVSLLETIRESNKKALKIKRL